MKDAKTLLQQKIHELFVKEVLKNSDRGEGLDDFVPYEGFIEHCVCQGFSTEEVAAALFNIFHERGISHPLDHVADERCFQMAEEIIAEWRRLKEEKPS
ncbi:MAG: hypothetical protein KDD64_04125 [Bdellovibrionales bacterium]|nr:hypothetical protein [Bdellovibrionales bacterium]